MSHCSKTGDAANRQCLRRRTGLRRVKEKKFFFSLVKENQGKSVWRVVESQGMRARSKKRQQSKFKGFRRQNLNISSF